MFERGIIFVFCCHYNKLPPSYTHTCSPHCSGGQKSEIHFTGVSMAASEDPRENLLFHIF